MKYLTQSTQRQRQFVAIVLAALALLLLAEEIARSQDYMLDRDFFSYWLAGRMVLTGQDPYAEAQWIAGHTAANTNWLSDNTFLYPLPLAIFFAPLGILPLTDAAILWAFLSAMMILASVLLMMSICQIPLKPGYLLPVVAGLALWRPAELTLLNGQLGALLLFLAVLVVACWERRKWLAGGMFLAMLALKPTVGIPLIGLLGIWLLMRRTWTGLLGIGVMSMLLLSLSWLRDANWLPKMLQIGNHKVNAVLGYSPTLWGLGGRACGHVMPCTLYLGGVAGVALILLGLALTAWYWRTGRPAVVMGGVIPVALLITPYLWAYDHLLLAIPVVVIMGELIQRQRPYLIGAMPFLGIAVLSLIFLFVAFAVSDDTLSAFVPGLVLILMIMLCRPPAILSEKRLPA